MLGRGQVSAVSHLAAVGDVARVGQACRRRLHRFFAPVNRPRAGRTARHGPCT